MSEERIKVLPNGAIYDTVAKKIIKTNEGQKKETSPKASASMGVEAPKSPKSRKKSDDEVIQVAKAHTTIAREILEYNTTHDIDKTNPEWLKERGFWYFDRCIEERVTPTSQGLVIALGFKVSEQNMLLSGNSGLPLECREIISAFRQALEMVAEGTLVDSKANTAGKIFDLKNRFSWTDNGNAVVEDGAKLGDVKSPEELRKALAKMPNLDLIDEPKKVVIDADYEVTE